METKGMMNWVLLIFSSSMNSNFIARFVTVFLFAIIVFLLKKDRTGNPVLPPGPIMHLKFGSRPVLIIYSSELAKECFAVNDLAFASRPSLAQGKHLGYNFMFMGWDPYGSYWRNARKICALELLSSKQIQTYRPKRMREICKTVKYLFEQAQMKSIVNMRSVLSLMTLNILMSMIMGDRYLGEEGGMSYEEIAHLIEESFVLHGVVNIGDYIPWLKWLDLQGYKREMKKPMEKEEMDFIDVLIIDVNMFSAGVDTSSLSVEWMLSLLLLHPDKMKMAQDEIDSKIGQSRLVEESDIPQLKYLQAIVKETMRLFPLAPLLSPHESIKSCTIGGFHIPARTILIVNTWVIHKDPRTWNQPLEFVPERFFEKNIEIESIKSSHNEFEMLPFGLGRRACPGASLAICMVHITLARLLQSFNWFLPNGSVLDLKEGVGLTIPKVVPLEVVIKARLPPHLYPICIK